MALTFLVAFSAVFGTSEAIKHIQSDARKKEHRSRKNHLIVRCPKSSQYSPILEGRRVVLSGDKLYIDTGTNYDEPFGHPFSGYYLPYPDTKYSGLVSTICEEPPIMNWIYIDRETYALKFGTRPWAEPNWHGPFDCSRQDRRLIFAGWEGFLAVKEGDFWAIYFDIDQDNLQSKVENGTPVLEVQLLRVEMRVNPVKKEQTNDSDSSNTTEENGKQETSESQGEEEAQLGEEEAKQQRQQNGDELESPDVD
ncbi:hypothetical protein F4779DRAFT_639777 [Xylariaceae sp. FL0662B]|nr:hypothetical protein F4779DRAFT_639777 [Xylariaceae sp. FL0662B]